MHHTKMLSPKESELVAIVDARTHRIMTTRSNERIKSGLHFLEPDGFLHLPTGVFYDHPIRLE